MRMFFVAGIGVAAFIELLLVSKKAKSDSDRVLTLWMFFALVHQFLMYVFITGDVYQYPILLGIEHPLPLLHGVFLYLYVGSLTGLLPDNKKLLLLHFAPAVVVYLYLIHFLVLPAEQKIEVYRNRGAGYELFLALKFYAIALSGVVYVTWSALLLKKHRTTIRDQFSDLGKVNLQWLRILTVGLGAVWCLVIFFRNETLTLAGVVIFVSLIGFFGVRQAVIFTPAPAPPEGDAQKKKYPKSGLTEEASAALHQALIRLMTEEALYRKSDLSITDLSARLGVHPNYLSQIINQKEQKNFYDFVNTYRCEEFKRLIAGHKNQQYTLLSLAYDCGFSSKSSFNRYFKKATGQTPSEYASALSGTPPDPA